MPKSLVAAAALALVSSGGATVAQPTPAQTPGNGVDMAVLHVQVILDHLGFSPGVLDGKRGMSLTAAIRGFQESRGLRKTGQLDASALAALKPYEGWTATKTLALSKQALAGPYINPIPHGEDKQAKLPGLYYRSPMEKLAEMFHTTPEVLMALNSPETPLRPGTKVVFPNALPTSRAYPVDLPQTWRATLNTLNVDAHAPRAAKIVVDKSESVLKVFDRRGRLVWVDIIGRRIHRLDPSTGAHESWPRTGPVYDVPISDEIEIPAPAFWRRLSTPSDVSGDPSAILPGSLPVWY